MKHVQIFGGDECDQIGRVLKFLETTFLAKEAQMIGNFLGYFEKPHSYVKTALATFWATFGKNWATFYSNIWSLCSHDGQEPIVWKVIAA